MNGPDVLTSLIDFASANAFWLIIGAIALAAIIGGTLKEILAVRAKERSRREIAAYIAEGSMTPEQGERLMKSGRA